MRQPTITKNRTDRKAWDVDGECSDCKCLCGATIYGRPEAMRFLRRLEAGEHRCHRCECARRAKVGE